MEDVVETEMDSTDLESIGEAEGETVVDLDSECGRDYVQVEDRYYPIWEYLGPAWIELIVGILYSWPFSLMQLIAFFAYLERVTRC